MNVFRRASFRLVELTAVLLAACAPVPQTPASPAPAPAATDDFRGRLAVGCKSKQECDALVAEADARGGRCVSAPTGDDCDRLLRDIHVASVLQANEKQADDATERTQNLQAMQARSDAEAQTRAVAQEQQAADAKVSGLKWQLKWYLDKKPYGQTVHTDGSVTLRPYLANEKNPGAHRKDIDDAKAILEQIRAADEGAATTAQPDFDSWLTEWEKYISDEETCRAAPKCLADRVAVPLCEAIAGKREALRGIAQERRNPAGVVNLTALHDMGEDAQIDEATIQELRAKYAALVHRAFNGLTCPKK